MYSSVHINLFNSSDLQIALAGGLEGRAVGTGYYFSGNDLPSIPISVKVNIQLFGLLFLFSSKYTAALQCHTRAGSASGHELSARDSGFYR